MTTILGISSHYHDSAAAILVDGNVIAAAQEERFSRIKHDSGFPTQAIAYCLEAAGLGDAPLDYVAYYEKPLAKFDRLLETFVAFSPHGARFFRSAIPSWTQSKLHINRTIRSHLGGRYKKRVIFVEHHRSHAAAAFYNSPFREAAILTLDGVGEWATTAVGTGKNNSIRLLTEIRFPHSLGLLYSAFTAYLGFRINDGEYKVMGLAPYGQPRFKDLILQRLMDLRDDGSFCLRMEYFEFCTGLTMTNRGFHDLFGGPPRRAGSEILQRHRDLAASIQAVIEEVMLRIAMTTRQRTACENLVLGGGVALNCVSNSRIADAGIFEKTYIFGAAGDSGAALGAAQFVWHDLLGHSKLDGPASGAGATRPLRLMLGPDFNDNQILQAFAAAGLKYHEYPNPKSLTAEVASLLAEQKIVGWFQGRMEFGPRALGSRSILADPRRAEMRSILNDKIKGRESFRPFAPVVLAEHAERYFKLPTGADCSGMTFVGYSRSPCAENLQGVFGAQPDTGPVGQASTETLAPSVTHVDGSSRVQIVNRYDNPLLHHLVSQFFDVTQCPLLINTSFNGPDEPIVCSPTDAIACFRRRSLDVLVIGRFLVHRDEQPDGLRIPSHDPADPDKYSKKSRTWFAKTFALRLAAIPLQSFATAVMYAVYFSLFSIAGMILRRHGSLTLRHDIEPDALTYWQDRSDDNGTQSHFRQS